MHIYTNTNHTNICNSSVHNNDTIASSNTANAKTKHTVHNS